jgi:hypothetical protein
MRVKIFISALLSVILISGTLQAQTATQMEVVADKAVVYSKPDESSPSKGILKKGRAVRTYGDNGEFLKVKLKAGEIGWVRAQDLQVREAELEDGSETPAAREEDFRRWHMQLGLSSGSSGQQSYTEINLGIGYFFTRWLEFHNAAFASLSRVTSTGTRNVYGLDSSLRGVVNTNLGGIAHIHAFAGPGYRLSESDFSTPFAEAGLITSIAGFSLGGGVRTLLYSMKNSSYSNENQYFIILSGTTSF